jgi:hypothetical protein
MARLRGALEIVRHLLPAGRAHSGGVGIIIIIAGVIIVHIYEERYEEQGQATETPTAFNASAKAKATPSYASNRAVTTQPCVCW